MGCRLRICGCPGGYWVVVSIREVYYDKAGNVSGYTKSAVDPYGQSIQELRDDLHKMLEATDKGVLS